MDLWLARPTSEQLERGMHPSTEALEQAIRGYIPTTNEHPQPSIWSKTADEILASVARFCQRTSASYHQERRD